MKVSHDSYVVPQLVSFEDFSVSVDMIRSKPTIVTMLRLFELRTGQTQQRRAILYIILGRLLLGTR